MFDASSSQAAAGRRIVTYAWDFGDNQANDEHGSDASHPYTSAGSYTVVLGVVDDLGRVGSSIRTIAVTNLGRLIRRPSTGRSCAARRSSAGIAECS